MSVQNIESQRLTYFIIASCLIFGAYGWLVFLMSFSHDGVIGPEYNAPGTDFMVFYSAARDFWQGKTKDIMDGAILTGQINASFSGWLSSRLPFHPWVYPPQFLLLVLPLGALPFPMSYGAFITGTFLFASGIICFYAETSKERWLLCFFLLLCPAASINVICGQNGFLTLALMVGGIGLAKRRPILAGIFLGVLTYKPQFWLMVPFALIALRNWKTLFFAVLSAAIFMAASILVFGGQFWTDWFLFIVRQGHNGSPQWEQWGRLWGVDLYACLVLLGVPGAVAETMQGVLSLGTGCVVYYAYRHPRFPEKVRMAIFLCASALAAPHALTYDLVLPGFAAGIVMWYSLSTQIWLCPPAAIFLLWLMPITQAPKVSFAGYAIPVVLLFALLSLIKGPNPSSALATVST